MRTVAPKERKRLLDEAHLHAHAFGWFAPTGSAILLILLLASLGAAQMKKRELLLMREDPSWTTFRFIDQNVRVTPSRGSPEEILILYDHMGCIHFPDPAIQAQRAEWIQRKYAVGNVVINQQLRVWEAYPWYIIGGVGVCLALTLPILGTLWQWAKKREFKKSFLDQMAFERMLSDLSTLLINQPEELVEQAIERSLPPIAKFLELDRITLFECARSTEELRVTLSWRDEGVRVVPGVIKFENFPWWGSRLVRGETVLVPNVEALPEEAITEKKFFAELGTKSAAIVPLKAGKELFGVISFASTKGRVVWARELVEHMRLMAEIFSNAMMRRHSELVVRESEDRFRMVANSAPVLIWMSCEDKQFTFFNQQWLSFTGRSLKQELGNGWTSGIHPDDLKRCLQTYCSAFDARLDFQMEYRLRRFDGAYHWIVDFGVPRFESDGTFRGYIGSCVDLTERKASEESLHNLTGRLIGAQEAERSRIARELHDDFSQRLALLGIELGQLWKKLPESEVEQRASVVEMLRGTKELSSDLHSLSHQLHSSKLEHVGIASALNGLCKEFGHKYKLEIHFTQCECPPNLPKDLALCLFRVAQEALSNVVKHSESKEAKVELRANRSDITLRISDRGKGFDPSLHDPTAGIGLIGMTERLRLAGGKLSIRSEPNRGTEIIAEVPVATPASEALVKTQAAGR